MRLKTRDVILLVLALSLGGAGTAQVILRMCRKGIASWYQKHYPYTDLSDNTFRVVLARLHRDKLVASDRRGIWQLTSRGMALVQILQRRLGYINRIPEKQATFADMIIAFDIPELQRKKRNKLRLELTALGFRPLQKSVWIDAGPLPRTFIDYLRDMRLLSYIHIFTTQKFGTLPREI